MKLVFKGIYKSDEQLPYGELPDNAIKFKEADSLDELNRKAVIITIPLIALVGMAIFISILIHGTSPFGTSLSDGIVDMMVNGIRNMGIAAIIFFATMIPHELLHAIAFGKGHVVEMFIAPKQMAMFVTSPKPMTKKRFIFLSLLPNIVLAWIPLIVWVALPLGGTLSIIWIWYCLFAMTSGAGDYMNVYNTIRQMPKGSMHQIHGFNSYWFMP